MATEPQAESPKPNVGRASVITMASLMLSRVLGIVRDSIMAAQFGRNAMTDAYSLAFMIPDLLFFLIAGGALSSAFIPVFSEYLHTGRREEAWKVFNSVATIMSVGLIVVISITFIAADFLVTRIIDPAQAENYALIAQMSRIVLPAQFAFFIGGLMFGTLYAHQRFAIPGLGPNVYNLSIILGAVVISHFVQPGIVGMAWGALIGAFVGNLLIPLWAMRGLGAPIRPSFNLKHEGVRKVFRLMLPVVLGLSLPGIYALIMRYFGSGFPEGIVTSLDLSNKLMQAPLGVFGQSFAIAAFPALSQFFSQGKMDAYREQLIRTVRTALYITVPISILLALLAADVINVLFNHGAFRQTDPSSVVLCLQLFCLGIPAWCIHPVLMRGYFAMQETVKPIVLGTMTTVVFVALCWGLRETPLEWRALPLASSICAILLATFMLFSLRRDVEGLPIQRVREALDQTLLAGLAMTAALIAVLWFWVPTTQAPTWVSALRLVLCGVGGMMIYGAITRRFKMPEASTLDRAMQRVERMRGKGRS